MFMEPLEASDFCLKGREVMKELVVISGKGGTGKTSLLGAFAALGEDTIMCDADVDAADLHLLLKPEIMETHEFRAGHRAFIDPERCNECGDCRERCRFDAISEHFQVDAIACEGCGVCWYFCPSKAIDFPENVCGEWYYSQTRFGPMVHAQLGIAEENSGRLVTLVRREARRRGEELGKKLILTDGPPGIGCPVIASMGGASAVLVITEPTVSGRHDLDRVTQLGDHFKIPVLVCVNKADLYWEASQDMESFCWQRGYKFLAHLPFDPAFTQAQLEGKTIVEHPSGPGKEAVVELWRRVEKEIL